MFNLTNMNRTRRAPGTSRPNSGLPQPSSHGAEPTNLASLVSRARSGSSRSSSGDPFGISRLLPKPAPAPAPAPRGPFGMRLPAPSPQPSPTPMPVPVPVPFAQKKPRVAPPKAAGTNPFTPQFSNDPLGARKALRAMQVQAKKQAAKLVEEREKAALGQAEQAALKKAAAKQEVEAKSNVASLSLLTNSLFKSVNRKNADALTKQLDGEKLKATAQASKVEKQKADKAEAVKNMAARAETAFAIRKDALDVKLAETAAVMNIVEPAAPMPQADPVLMDQQVQTFAATATPEEKSNMPLIIGGLVVVGLVGGYFFMKKKG